MGELLPSAYVKRFVNQHQVILRSNILRIHQWASACPALVRASAAGAIEPLAANGTLEPLVAADLDIVNVFGNAEWPRIRQALRPHFPEASAWTEWQHQADFRHHLHRSHLRHLLGRRAGRRAWHSPECAGAGAGA